MKYLFAVVLSLLSVGVGAQDKIFRCGNEYTTNEAEAKKLNCKQILPVELSASDKLKYQACQTEATKMPTELGVREGMRLCRVKFGLEKDRP